MSRGKAYRRMQEKKAKSRARRFELTHSYRPQLDDRSIGIHARSPKRCSNPACCGNPRRLRTAKWAIPMDERRKDFNLAMNDYYDELDELDREMEQLIRDYGFDSEDDWY